MLHFEEQGFKAYTGRWTRKEQQQLDANIEAFKAVRVKYFELEPDGS